MSKAILERAARAVAMASDADTAARATIGQEPYIQDKHRRIARAVLEAITKPSDKMVRAGEAWQRHCSDVDSCWEEMVKAALYPEDYPGLDLPYEDGAIFVGDCAHPQRLAIVYRTDDA